VEDSVRKEKKYKSFLERKEKRMGREQRNPCCTDTVLIPAWSAAGKGKKIKRARKGMGGRRPATSQS